MCELFTDKTLSNVPLWRFGTFKTVVDAAAFIQQLGPAFYEDFADMLVFDALICNTDRHQGNFGLLVDAETNTPVSMAPVFDNGLGLFPYAVAENMEHPEEYAKTLVSAFDVSFEELAAAFITDRQRAQLRKLLSFRFKPDKNYNWPVKRLRAVEAFIRSRAGQLMKL